MARRRRLFLLMVVSVLAGVLLFALVSIKETPKDLRFSYNAASSVFQISNPGNTGLIFQCVWVQVRTGNGWQKAGDAYPDRWSTLEPGETKDLPVKVPASGPWRLLVTYSYKQTGIPGFFRRIELSWQQRQWLFKSGVTVWGEKQYETTSDPIDK